jgi:CRISPR-associated endonuclease/helicase Cas3
MVSKYYAHTATLPDKTPDCDKDHWQLLPDHLHNVADQAAVFGAAFNAAEWTRVLGLWHDIGKYSDPFQRYLHIVGGADDETKEVAGKVDHSTAGSQLSKKTIAKLGALMSYQIAGHHAGLANGRDSTYSCLEERLKKDIPDFTQAPEEFIKAYENARPRPPGFAFTSGFSLGFFLRMTFSALVDADWLDTEAFMDARKSATRQRLAQPTMKELRACLDQHLNRFGPPKSAVNVARAEVLDACRKSARTSPGLFSLTVPTGGGKTLASMAFALDHAIRNGCERVIYVIPFTSIIEQNAQTFREVFAPLGDDIVIEHHSNVETNCRDDDGQFSPDKFAARLATENWDARIIVTTNVQFFESLFSNTPRQCRKLHRIAKSVVILDEAQALPLPLLKPCIRTLQELASPGRYNTSVVLCTATQPAIEYREDFKSGLVGVREIIPDPKKLFASLRRVRIHDLGRTPLLDLDLAQRLSEQPQVLCIVNTRKHAGLLYDALPKDGTAMHLSALMCAQHRSDRLGATSNPRPGTVRHALQQGLPCRVVTTQLIEAGVDADFPVVYRALAGLDSIAQAAGRCNREGRLQGLGATYVFTPEHVIPRGFLRKAADVSAEVMPLHLEDPLCPEAIEAYFRLHYWKNESQTDLKKILDCFPVLQSEESFMGFRFKDCAEAFKIIDSTYKTVFVPYGAGAELIDELRAAFEPKEQRRIVRQLQRYIVNVPESHVNANLNRGITTIHESYLIVDDSLAYTEATGLNLVAPSRGLQPAETKVYAGALIG